MTPDQIAAAKNGEAFLAKPAAAAPYAAEPAPPAAPAPVVSVMNPPADFWADFPQNSTVATAATVESIPLSPADSQAIESDKSGPWNDYAQPAEPLTFHGYTCTQDCSGHEAGYQWAQDNDIDDTDDCNGNSNSFNEGCEAWVEENAGDASDDHNDNN